MKKSNGFLREYLVPILFLLMVIFSVMVSLAKAEESNELAGFENIIAQVEKSGVKLYQISEHSYCPSLGLVVNATSLKGFNVDWEVKKIIQNLFEKPCYHRNIQCGYYKIGNGKLPNMVGFILQIFEDEESIRDFSVLNQPVRDPRWAKGVVAIIEVAYYKKNFLLNEVKVKSGNEEKTIYSFEEETKKYFSQGGFF